MAIRVAIMGESGTGKSTSLRNFSEDEILLINVGGKPLPFRKKFETVNSDDPMDITYAMKSTKKKVIVLDDIQMVMSNSFMRRIQEKGWDKFNDMGADYFKVLGCVDELPDDVIVYFLSHTKVDDAGIERIKTIGKAIDNNATLEGYFSIVLKTAVADGTYNFVTQNNGRDTVKSPIGMFESFSIDNDLKYVDERIRNYYFMEGAMSDEEMEKKSEEVANENVEPKTRRRGRPRKEEVEKPKAEEEKVEEEKLEAIDPETGEIFEVEKGGATSQPAPRRRRRRRDASEEPEVEPLSDDDIPF